MPAVRRKPGAAEPKRLGWKEIRISYLTLKVWGVIVVLVAAGAAGNVWYARSRGNESLVGRIFSIARRSVDKRIQVLTAPAGTEELLEQRFAVLSFFSGRVEIQRATDLAWRGADEKMQLATGDRVRTFSNGRAEVSFDDGNVLRIKPDSLIVIGDLTENVRTKVKKSSVRLLVSSIEADVKKSVVRGSTFRLEMPTATADIEKARVALEVRKDNQSRLSVFAGQVDLDTGAQKVKVSDRQAVTVSAARQVTSPELLLPAPRLRAPKPLESVTTATGGAPLAAAWDPVAGARTYRLEVAADRFFDEVAASLEDVRGTDAKTASLQPGVYFVRVAAVDVQGHVGDFAEGVPVRVVLDTTPPFLEIEKLVVMRAGRGRDVLVSGRTEPGVTLTVGGRAVAVDPGGSFSAVLRDLGAERGEVHVRAVDRAGNVRELRQAVAS